MTEYIDDDGYPTDEALEKIEKWEINKSDDYIKLLDFCRSLWFYPDYCKKEGKVYTFITIGWSGNESIIGALHNNFLFYINYWYSSERGGKHVYCPPGVDP
jgi:hypothetical protein